MWPQKTAQQARARRDEISSKLSSITFYSQSANIHVHCTRIGAVIHGVTQKSRFPKDVREPAFILFTLPISPAFL